MVTTSTTVRRPTRRSPRTVKPTRSPTSSPNSQAIPRAAARATIRRGSATTTRRTGPPACSSPARASGTSVVFPVPGGAHSTAGPVRLQGVPQRGHGASAGQVVEHVSMDRHASYPRSDHCTPPRRGRPLATGARGRASRGPLSQSADPGDDPRDAPEPDGSVPLAHKDRRAGDELAAQRGPAAPLLRVPARPLGLDEVHEPETAADHVPDPVAERPVVLDVDGAAGRVLLDVGRAVEVGGRHREPLRAGSSGKAQRIGCVTENTQRPPGRTSRITRTGSATNGTAPYAEHARSKLPSAKGSDPASACTSGTDAAGEAPSAIRRAFWSWRCERSSATGRAPRAASQREH